MREMDEAALAVDVGGRKRVEEEETPKNHRHL